MENQKLYLSQVECTGCSNNFYHSSDKEVSCPECGSSMTIKTSSFAIVVGDEELQVAIDVCGGTVQNVATNIEGLTTTVVDSDMEVSEELPIGVVLTAEEKEEIFSNLPYTGHALCFVKQ